MRKSMLSTKLGLPAPSPTADPDAQALVLRPQDLRKSAGSYSGALIKRAQAGEVVAYGDAPRLWGGLERVELMAEDLSRGAVRPPWKFEQLRRISDSQLDARMDDIDSLHSADFFYEEMLKCIKSRVESLPDAETGEKKDMTKDASFVASATGVRIHYAYLSASSWHLIRLLLDTLPLLGVDDANVRNKLHQSRPVRDVYMQLFDLAQRVTEMERYRLGQACAASAHFSRYFERRQTADGHARMAFKPGSTKELYLNLVDLLVVQLALPGDAGWSVQQLLAMLHEALADDLKEEYKLSQEVNDVLGDLSTAVQLLDMIDFPLSGPEAERWKNQQPVLTPEYQAYLNCQEHSRVALSNTDAYQPYIWPLDKTKMQDNLDEMWKAIDLTCLRETENTFSFEQLWGLETARQPSPQWTYIGISPSSGDSKSGAARGKQKQITNIRHNYDPYELQLVPIGNSKALSRTERAGTLEHMKKTGSLHSSRPALEANDEPPPLLSASDNEATKESEESASDDSESNDELDLDNEIPGLRPLADYGQDTDDEEEFGRPWSGTGKATSKKRDAKWTTPDPHILEELFQEAIKNADTVLDDLPDWVEQEQDDAGVTGGKLGPKKPTKRVLNPLKRLLAVLTGRSVTADEPASTEKRSSKPYMHSTQSPAPKPAAKANEDQDESDGMPELIPFHPRTQGGNHGTPSHSQSNNIQEEQEDSQAAVSKKKKKPKRKSTKSSTATLAELVASMNSRSEPAAAESVLSSTSSTTPPTSAGRGGATSQLDVSRIPSLPVGETIALSGSAYLRGKNEEAAEKVKTRGIENLAEARKKMRTWTPFRKTEKLQSESDTEPKKPSVFDAMKNAFRFTISDSTADIMRRILHAVEISTEADDEDGTAVVLSRAVKADRMRPMKWSEFVKGMIGMGFSIDLTTAGSSVRFDPPDPNDRSFTVHKPHPQNEYAPNQLRRIGWRLKKHYGWMDESFKPWDDKA